MAKTKVKTNIETVNLDAELMEEAMKLSKGKTTVEVINEALRKYIIGFKNRELLDMKGKIYWDGDLNEMRGA
ncbi:type II toxin-antitoxin system VapB family antitoxin [Chitinophaga polysaccharea]|uniref:type II toxin-antitoxin system VapB family antitoxin n=1 Tax=Chitinophaga TaxID=79328 RepID=UPI001455A813|nr:MULTISPECIES: type II toxin-antitoxin system VapB family antitoxin [Chitinophaga]NLR61645.1 type II toxin-antitoxin system VapB family antitoxin [Chitinophaga polysaccharea]NLU93760.1 type II toxin-antitoxin system VapB family antitoxin [Chitinophaga sp. Ak27]